jgi:hypothetical protein
VTNGTCDKWRALDGPLTHVNTQELVRQVMRTNLTGSAIDEELQQALVLAATDGTESSTSHTSGTSSPEASKAIPTNMLGVMAFQQQAMMAQAAWMQSQRMAAMMAPSMMGMPAFTMPSTTGTAATTMPSFGMAPPMLNTIFAAAMGNMQRQMLAGAAAATNSVQGLVLPGASTQASSPDRTT